MRFERPDVLVIGGGAAGLAAARRLSGRGLSVTVVEARDRLGGRIHTLHHPTLPLPVELGAEFIHGKPLEIWAWLRSSGTAACEVTGEDWQSTGGKLKRIDPPPERLRAVLDRLAAVGPDDESFAGFLEARCQDQPREVLELATAYLEGFHAAPAEVASSLAFAADRKRVAALGQSHFRLVEGYDSVVRWLREGIDPAKSAVLLGTTVRAVHWRRGEVRLEVESAPGPLPVLEARRAVITLPASVLEATGGEAAAVRFEPEVDGHRQAARRLGMGKVVKVVLRFREAFWENEALPAVEGGRSLAGWGFLLSRDPHYPTWWTALPARAPILTAWAGGPAAERLEGLPSIQRLHAALDSLARLLGATRASIAGRLQACYTHDWQADPFSRGAYSFVPVGGLGVRQRLARPIEDTLFWAGEATHFEGQAATVAGAIATGYRAAEEVLAAEGGG